MTEVRGQRTEVRGQMTEVRRQMTEDDEVGRIGQMEKKLEGGPVVVR